MNRVWSLFKAGLDETGRMSQSMHAQLLFLDIPHDRHVDLGVL